MHLRAEGQLKRHEERVVVPLHHQRTRRGLGHGDIALGAHQLRHGVVDAEQSEPIRDVVSRFVLALDDGGDSHRQIGGRDWAVT